MTRTCVQNIHRDDLSEARHDMKYSNYALEGSDASCTTDVLICIGNFYITSRRKIGLQLPCEDSIDKKEAREKKRPTSITPSTSCKKKVSIEVHAYPEVVQCAAVKYVLVKCIAFLYKL